MKPDKADIRLLIELYADGELGPDERRNAERLLESDASAREYLLALQEMRALVAAPVEEAAEQVDFSGLFGRVAESLHLDGAPARTADMDALVVAWADGQVRDDGEVARVQSYVAAHPGAAEGVAAIRELGELVRAPIEYAAEQVDFDALARRIDAAVAAEAIGAPALAPAAAAPGWFARFVEAIGGRAVLASAITAAAVVVIMLPFTGNRDGGDGVQIHNHYYEFAPAETVGYQWDSIEKGYEGTFQPGDKDTAPVIWIAPEGSSDWQKQPENDPDAGHRSDTSL